MAEPPTSLPEFGARITRENSYSLNSRMFMPLSDVDGAGAWTRPNAGATKVQIAELFDDPPRSDTYIGRTLRDPPQGPGKLSAKWT